MIVGKEEERQMFQQMQAMAQKQVIDSFILSEARARRFDPIKKHIYFVYFEISLFFFLIITSVKIHYTYIYIYNYLY